MMTRRFTTGLLELDEALGGGLLPGTLTIVAGATGVGKTQFGIHFLHADVPQHKPSGAIIDLSSRGDSQHHEGYAQRIFGRNLTSVDVRGHELPSPFTAGRPADIMPFLGYGGKRVLRSQMDGDQWDAWQSEMNRRMPQLFRFVYGHLLHGTQRFVIDGIEPQETVGDSLQLDMTELIYHRMMRQEHDWLAREVLREKYRDNEAHVQAHAYDHTQTATLVLLTTKQLMLEPLMTQPLADGDLAAGANTVILLGRVPQGQTVGRAMFIAKHRGSYARQDVIPFEINDHGIQFSSL